MTQDTQGLPPLSPSFSDGIYEELIRMDVQLDADPLPYGPKRLNGKIALTRKHLSRAERIFLDLSQQCARYKRGLRSATLILELEKKHLLANDPEVRAGRAVSERDAIAAGKLKAEVMEVANCQHAVEELEMVLAVVKSKRTDLKDIQGRLRDQMKVCQEELALGGRWGSKSPTRGTELEAGQGFADGADVEEVDNLIQNVRSVAKTELHMVAQVDSSDSTEEEEEDLAAAAPTPQKSSINVPAPVVPLVDEDDAIPDTAALVEEDDEEVGGDDDPFADVEEVEGDVLEATSTKDEIDDFLDSPTMLGSGKKKKMSRREIEDADDLDIDALLANFTD